MGWCGIIHSENFPSPIPDGYNGNPWHCMPHERSMGLRSEIGEFFMRAIFINAVDQKVEEIQIENELHAFYERIGCDMIQCVDVGESNLLVCDEEGRLRNWKVGFRWPGSEGIAGNALLVCVDKNDDFTDAKVPKILIERNIKFLDLEKTPLPPPAFGCAFIPDLTPESIEAARAEAMHDLLRNREC